MRLTTAGVAAHGSAPELGDNAVVRVARAAVALHEYDGWPVHDVFGPVTANVGLLRGGVQPNVVPDTAETAPRCPHGAGLRSASNLYKCRVRARLATPSVVEDQVVLPVVDTDLARPVRRQWCARRCMRPGWTTYRHPPPATSPTLRCWHRYSLPAAALPGRRSSSDRGSRNSVTWSTSGARRPRSRRPSRCTRRCSTGGASAWLPAEVTRAVAHLAQRHTCPSRTSTATGGFGVGWFRRWSRTSGRPSSERSRRARRREDAAQDRTSPHSPASIAAHSAAVGAGKLGQLVQHLRDAHPPRVGDQLTHLSGLEPGQVRAHPLVAQVRGRGQEEGLRIRRHQAVALRPGEPETHGQLVAGERDEHQLPDLELPAAPDLALVGARQGQADPADVVGGGHAPG